MRVPLCHRITSVLVSALVFFQVVEDDVSRFAAAAVGSSSDASSTPAPAGAGSATGAPAAAPAKPKKAVPSPVETAVTAFCAKKPGKGHGMDEPPLTAAHAVALALPVPKLFADLAAKVQVGLTVLCRSCHL